jgi:hypothetical protein
MKPSESTAPLLLGLAQLQIVLQSCRACGQKIRAKHVKKAAKQS